MCIANGYEYAAKYKTITEAIDDLCGFVWKLDSEKKDLDFSRTKSFEFNCGQKYEVTIRRVK